LAERRVFPAIPVGKQRRVDLKGEGYFEVAKNAAMPFVVTAGKMDVLVLGTHFNIMSYGDEENMNTTLLEGNINLTNNGITKNLRPGHQAVVSRSTNAIAISTANVKQVMAWKNGEFRFKEAGIKEIMRQVSRWYNVDVEYQTKNDDQYFTASLPRMQNVSALLQMLELTGTVHFKIDHKKIIVLP
jgi:transmembrane sensor